MRRLSVLGSAAAALLLVLLRRCGDKRALPATMGMSLFGDLKYGPDFKHFDYVNPDAPKGGTMKFSAIGTFDTLNPFVVKGVPAAGIGQIFDTLMAAVRRRAGQRIRSRRRKRRGRARQDVGAVHAAAGGAVPRRLADDARRCRLDFDTLRTRATRCTARITATSTKVGAEGEHGVRFTFKIGRQPRIAGDPRRRLPVLSKKYWAGKDFSKTTLDAAARQRPLQGRDRSIPAARSPISESPITGARTCRSTRAAIMSIRSATTITVTERSRSRRSRPGSMISGARILAKSWATGYDRARH